MSAWKPLPFYCVKTTEEGRPEFCLQIFIQDHALFKTTLRVKGGKKITPHEVLRVYDVLTHFRNLCAHDERLYCAKVGNDDYAAMLKLMEVVLPRDVVSNMKKDIECLLRKYKDELNVITAQDLRTRLGL